MTEASYLDCNVSFGSPPAGVFRPCTTVEELIAELDWAGVDQALVHHALMRSQSPVVGNAALVEAIAAVNAGQERLIGSWAILPPQTDEWGDADAPGAAGHGAAGHGAFFAAMARAGVRALWAFPQDHRYLLDRTTFGGFLDEVSARRIPLFLPRDAGGPRPPDTWSLVSRLLGECPELTLVVAAHGPWGEDRFFRPLLARYPRLHLDISRYELDCGVREVVRHYGADRLLYGSNFPNNAMGGPRLMIAQAEIDDEARRSIAGDNLRRLLAEVRLP